MKHDPWWKQPVTTLLWREIRSHGRTRRELVALQDSVAELVAGSEALFRQVDGWRLRCDAMYQIADPDLRDGVLGTINTLERLIVAEPDRPRRGTA